MESKKGLKAPEKLCIIGSLLRTFFLKFRNRDLVCRCHGLFSSGFICTRNASIRAPTQTIPVQSPVALKLKRTATENHYKHTNVPTHTLYWVFPSRMTANLASHPSGTAGYSHPGVGGCRTTVCFKGDASAAPSAVVAPTAAAPVAALVLLPTLAPPCKTPPSSAPKPTRAASAPVDVPASVPAPSPSRSSCWRGPAELAAYSASLGLCIARSSPSFWCCCCWCVEENALLFTAVAVEKKDVPGKEDPSSLPRWCWERVQLPTPRCCCCCWFCCCCRYCSRSVPCCWKSGLKEGVICRK